MPSNTEGPVVDYAISDRLMPAEKATNNTRHTGFNKTLA